MHTQDTLDRLCPLAGLGILLVELGKVAGEKEVWLSLLRLLLDDLTLVKWQKMDGWTPPPFVLPERFLV